MDFKNLPHFYFEKVLKLLPIDEREKIYPIFSPFHKNSFRNVQKILSITKSLGISTLMLDSKMETKLNYHLNHKENMGQPWHCSDSDHMPVHLFSSNQVLQSKCNCCEESWLVCTLKRCPYIESLDLRGLNLTKDLMQNLVSLCPNLICIKLNFVTFDESSFEIFKNIICPKILHMSFDNILFKKTELNDLITKLKCVEELEILIFSRSATPPDVFGKLSHTLAYLSLLLYRSNKKKNQISQLDGNLVSCFEKMAEGPAKNIEYLKIMSNYHPVTNFNLTLQLEKFTNLKSLNMSYMNNNTYIYGLDDKFRTTNWWPKLQCLAIDLYDLLGADNLLWIFLNRTYYYNLQILQLMSCKLHKHISYMPLHCPNLVQLTLYDVFFMPFAFEKIFEYLKQLKDLKTLNIEYTFVRLESNTFSKTSMLNYRRYYAFPSKRMYVLEDFVAEHPSLTYLSLIDWPGLPRAKLDRLFTIARLRNIIIEFREAI